MASWIGAGSLLACILNEGVHLIVVECVKVLLELFRKCNSDPYPPLIHLGGMLRVVNAMGASAGILVHINHLISMQTGYVQKVLFYCSSDIFLSLVSFFLIGYVYK